MSPGKEYIMANMGKGLDQAGLEQLWGRIETLLGGKAAASHTHVCANITDLETYLNDYAKKSDLSTVYKWKGSCTWAQLIAKTDAVVGDVWNITDKDGMNYGCKVAATAGEESWDALGTTTTISLDGYYTSSQVDNLLNGKADAEDLTALQGTVSQLQTTVAGKANSADVYTKTDTYSKTEVNGLIPQALTSEEITAIIGA